MASNERRHGGRNTLKTTLHVSGINKSVSDSAIARAFAQFGPVKITTIADKNRRGCNYSFVAFESEAQAQAALDESAQLRIDGLPVSLNWAYGLLTFTTTAKQGAHMIFVGDLARNVDDEALKTFFSDYESLISAHVMWDMKLTRLRGYGFVSFGSASDADAAIADKNGALLEGRAIRCNRATFRPKTKKRPERLFAGVLRESHIFNTTVFLGNIAEDVDYGNLVSVVRNFGYVLGVDMRRKSQCAFVRYDTHEQAATAIVHLSGYPLRGRPLKSGWGRVFY